MGKYVSQKSVIDAYLGGEGSGRCGGNGRLYIDGGRLMYDGGGNMVRQTDEHGNVLWARRIYTIDEANRVAGTKNRISIRYR